jgi:hypothetical protein
MGCRGAAALTQQQRPPPACPGWCLGNAPVQGLTLRLLLCVPATPAWLL